MKRACLLLLPTILLIVLAASGCNDESKPIFSRVRVTPACGVMPLQVEGFAAVSGGNETGDPLGGTNKLEVTWSFGDGGTGNTSISYHKYEEAGTFTVTVTAKDPDGNTTTSSVPVTVMADSLVVTARSDDLAAGTVTVGQDIHFDLTALACDINYPEVIGDEVKMVYRWEMGDAAETVFEGVAPVFNYSVTGDYTVDVTVTYPAQAVTRHSTLSFTVAP